MRNALLTIAACALLAWPAMAQDEEVAFHIRLTDARTALLANPRFDELKISPEQLERAAHDRVMLLDHTSGMHWTWLMLGWPEGKPPAEHGLNGRGVALPGKDADFSVTPKSEETVTIRCLHEQCRIEKATLKKDESTDVPFDSDVTVAWPASR